jgi:hypothetical protein
MFLVEKFFEFDVSFVYGGGQTETIQNIVCTLQV